MHFKGTILIKQEKQLLLNKSGVAETENSITSIFLTDSEMWKPRKFRLGMSDTINNGRENN